MIIPTALYPFTPQLLPIVKMFEKLQDKYKITTLISPPGLGLTGKDAAFSCNNSPIGLVVTEDFEDNFQNWEVLFLSRVLDEKTINDQHLEEIAEKVLEANMLVEYFDTILEAVPPKIMDLAQKYPNKLKLHVDETLNFQRPSTFDRYNHVDKPVILVGSLFRNADTLEVLLRLAALLRKNGAHPTVLANQPICRSFGFHNITRGFFDVSQEEHNKIQAMNEYIKKLEHDEAPDIFLLEAPDPLMRFNDTMPNGFGILSYMLCQAITPDAIICCAPFELAVEPLIEMLSRDFSVRYGSPIFAVNVSNLAIDSMDMLQSHRAAYVHVDMAIVESCIASKSNDFPIPFFNITKTGEEELQPILNNLLEIL